MSLTIEQAEKRIGSFLNKCPSCKHKQYSYTKECEECRFSWLRYYNQLKGNPLDKEYNNDKVAN